VVWWDRWGDGRSKPLSATVLLGGCVSTKPSAEKSIDVYLSPVHSRVLEETIKGKKKLEQTTPRTMERRGGG